MNGTGRTAFFSGWVGLGTGVSAGSLLEPTGAAYNRRPVLYAALSLRYAQDISTGSIGPSDGSWSPFFAGGLFSAAVGGSPLATWILQRPISIPAGVTFTAAARFSMILDLPGSPVIRQYVWLAGMQLGELDDGSIVIASQNLQVADGVLSSLSEASTSGQTGTLPSLASLPTSAPEAGSGLLWNNGGVICIA